MASELAKMPNIPIPLSRFKQDFNHSLSMIHGDLVPVDCFEVLPGDTFSYELSSLIRMSTPVVPIMGNITAYVHAFFVPMRLIWDDTEKFFGDPSNHDKVSSITPVTPGSVTVPKFTITAQNFLLTAGGTSFDVTNFDHSVSDYLGKPDVYKINNDVGPSMSDWTDLFNDNNISCLKERAYYTIWNDHFRPSLMVPPVLVNKASTASGTSIIGVESFTSGSPNNQLKYGSPCLKSFKKYDYFTANTFSPQFGNSVALPLGTMAPVHLGTSAGTLTGSYDWSLKNLVNGTKDQNIGSPVNHKISITGLGGTEASTGFLFADLTNATASTINNLRYAFQVQKYLERSNYGSRFFEILNAHYGVTNPDLRLQRAQRLGSHKFYINISQVLSTNNSNDVNLGQTGAVSVTGDKCSLFTAKFDEPGYVMVLVTTKYDRQYSSGFLREDMRKELYEFYSPEFANLGDQATKQLELQLFDVNDELVIKDAVLGYQEHWAEYRYRKNLVSGKLRPGHGLDIWTLADDFEESNLVLGYDFLKEDRAALARCLVTGQNGPDYVCDYHADIIATREMPLYSIPGLIDHFGAL